MFYYAMLNKKGIITSTYASPVRVRTSKYLVEIREKDKGAIGRQFWACSTDNVQYLNTTKSLSDKLEEIDNELSAEGGNVASLVSEVADVKAIAENAEAEAGNNTAAIGSVRVDIQLAKDRMDGIADQVSAVISSVGDARHELGQLEADFIETKAKTEEALKAANTRIDSMQSGFLKDLAAVNDAIAENSTAIGNLVTSTAENAIGIQNLEAVNTQQNAEITRINQNVEAVIHTANDHESRINDLDDALYAFKDETAKNIEQVNNNFQQVNTNFDGVREDIDTIRSRVDANERNFAAVNARVTNAFSDIEALDGAVTKLGTRTTAVESRATTLEKDVATNKTNITNLTTKTNTNATNISSLAGRVTNAESKLNTATSNISSLTNRTTAAEKAIDGVESEISAVKADMTNYLPVTGGTVSGDLNVDGVIRVNGSQAFFFNEEAKAMNIGTNNATTVNLAGVHSGGTMNVNSAMFRPYSVIPRNTDSLLGNTNFRWKGIYSQAAVNVSSDERLKKDIASTDGEELAEFISKLPVKTFKYKDDELSLDRIGLIAQDVIKADPKLSRYFVSSEGDGYYSLKPADLVFPLIAAVQKLQDEVEQLKK